MRWLLGAAVNTGILAAFLAFVWAAFAILERALDHIDQWRHR